MKQERKLCYVGLGVSLIIGLIIGVYIGRATVENACNSTNKSEVLSVQRLKEDVPIDSESELEVIELKQVCVDIEGAVYDPGVQCLDEGSIIEDAIKAAGGVKGSVYSAQYVRHNINKAKKLVDSSKIYIPFKQDAICVLNSVGYQLEQDSLYGNLSKSIALQISDSLEKEGERISEEIYAQLLDEFVDVIPDDINEQDNSSSNSDDDDNSSNNNASCININSATIAVLIELDGIGEATAQKIIDARPFANITDLLDVSGIGDAKYNAIKDDVCI